MAEIKVCDLLVGGAKHGVPAKFHFQASMNSHALEADLCEECKVRVEATLTSMGIVEGVAIVDSKPRALYVAKSGRSFTTVEAREWLLANGHIHSTRGRVKDEHLKLFGDHH